MGISVEQWRLRIGSYGRTRNFSPKIQDGVNIFTLLMFLCAAALVGVLLVIGGVEVNPGPFPCDFCPKIPETIASSVRHQQMHVLNRNFQFSCPVKECQFFSTSYASLNFHVSKFHRTIRHQDPSATERILCSYVSMNGEGTCTYSTTSLWEFVQHLCKHISANTAVSCPITGCSFASKFVKSSTFRVHLSQYHKHWAAEGCPKQTKVDAPVVVDNLAFEDIDPAENEENEDRYESEQCFDFDENVDSDLLNDELIYDTIADFYLNMYAIDLLPASLIQRISNDITFISNIVQARMNLVVTSALKKLGIEEDKIRAICLDMKLADPLYATHHKNVPGPSLTSDYLRKKYFIDNFNYQPPVEISLNENDPTSDEKYMYISPTTTLQILLKDSSVQEQIDASFSQEPEDSNIISDYKSGTLFLNENHPPREIQLFVYQDTINAVMNALGSAKNKFKMLAMYFTIANYAPYIRSKVDTKYVAILIRESVFKKVGQKVCFERILNEFQKLATEGILYKGVEKIKVVVQYMLGDNLGQHTIGGFIESFSGTYFCRYCPTTREEFKANPHLTKAQRTIDEYDECVRRAPLSEYGHDKGVKEDSAFNGLQNFHAVSHLVPDLAHDLFEGVIAYDMAGIIDHFVKKKFFSYDLLNRRIKAFQCRAGDRPNKPALVPERKEKLAGHAIQNWTMLRLFPFIVGDLIDDFEDPGWLLYLKLKELSEYFCAPSQDKCNLPFIKDVLLPAYFELRAAVLTSKKYGLKPKHHFMAHLVELMLKYASLINFWTLSYEQRHKFFKLVMRMSKNYINPEYTCAVRYQLNFCSMVKSGPLFSKRCMEIQTKLRAEWDFPCEMVQFLEELNLENDWRFSKGVVFNELTYNLNELLLLSSEEGNLQVGFIKAIATRQDSLFFVLEVATAHNNPVEGIYHLPPNPSGQYVWKPASDLQHPVTQPVYVHRGVQAFSLKYHI